MSAPALIGARTTTEISGRNLGALLRQVREDKLFSWRRRLGVGIGAVESEYLPCSASAHPFPPVAVPDRRHPDSKTDIGGNGDPTTA